MMKYKRGDLIVLDEPAGAEFNSNGWCSGVHDRTGNTGEFATECVFVLPTLSKPPQDIVVSAQL